MAHSLARQEEGTFFERASLETDAELSEDASLAPGGRRAEPASFRFRWVLGALLAGAFVLAAGFTLRRQSLHDADVMSVQIAAEEEEDGIEPFGKCGGSDYMGPTCCQRGCACIIQSRFYSQCEAPAGGMRCNVEKAKDEIMIAKERAVEARPAALHASKAAKVALEAEMEARKQLQAAQATLDELTAKGAKVRNEKDQQERLVEDAKHEADSARKAAEAKLKHYRDVKKEIEDINKTASLRSHGQCGSMFSNCGPVAPPHLTAYMACCQDGCICKWRDAFYAQCEAPPGRSSCDPAGEAEHIKERVATMAKLLKEHEELESRRKKTKDNAEELDRQANAVRHRAAIAGTARVKAHSVMMHKKLLAQNRAHEAKRLAQAAEHAKHAIHYSRVAIKAWESAAEGRHCGGSDADKAKDVPGEEEEEKVHMKGDHDSEVNEMSV